MLEDKINVTIVLPMPPELIERVRSVSDRLDVTYLTKTQRHVYREGRPLWAGYPEEPIGDEETEDEARARLNEVLKHTHILLSNPIVPDDILERAPEVRMVQLTSAGADRLIDSELARSDRAKLVTASGLHATPISEYVIGAMIAFAKGFPRAMQGQQERTWRPFLAKELEGSTVAVLGLGNIGRRVAELSKALGMRVIGMRRSADRRMTGEEAGETCFDEMLPTNDLFYALGEADYIVLAMPLTDDSRHMIGEEQLRAMKPSAVIVNIARGAVIDQEALVRALKEGRIAGAALDVTDPEPLPPDNDLWTAPNVMITPHISGGTPRYMDRAIDIFVDNLQRYVADRELRNVVDPSRGY